MSIFPTSVLPKKLPKAVLLPGPPLRQDGQRLLEVARVEPYEVLRSLRTAPTGLTADEVERRLEEYGPNVVAEERRLGVLRLLGRAVMNPLVILLSVLAAVSLLTGDLRSSVVMAVMVLLGVVLRLVQEARADAAAAKLKAMIGVTATVLREGQRTEVPLGYLVPGDVVELSAGDMVPADVRLLSCKDLFVSQASLTGESLPVEKTDQRDEGRIGSPLELKNICFLGTSVESGSATAVIVTTGLTTYLGSLSTALVDQEAPTAFDLGISRFTWLMIRFIAVMVPLVFVINGLTKHNWGEAFFFALAVAVGLTPEMLPMIVTVCLSRGAIAMSRRKVIVKRLNSIQELGAMDVLCTDKTGTLTRDRVILETHCDVVLREDSDVLLLAYLNSHFQTGLKNVLDRALLQHNEVHERLTIPAYTKLDEIPFDFSRKIMSVVVKSPEGRWRIITKGAPEEVYKRCTHYELDGAVYDTTDLILTDLHEEYERLSADGFRVLAVAYKDLEPRPAYSQEDEHGLILKGYVAFLDPPKDTAQTALQAMRELGIGIKVLTGDNELVSRKICREVGLVSEHVLLGSQVDAMSDAELAKAAEQATLFARLSPSHKQRIIGVLRAAGHVVGFLGDGINDAPALRAANVGISVDSAADIAKESADLILLEKSLLVLHAGVVEGRNVFANILKYIRMGASSNFGNMFSVLGASLVLPFVPMAPVQILTNNLLYDFSQIPIPTDDVDPEQVARPRPWTIGDIARYILCIGPCSSVFDYTTYAMMVFVFGCWEPASAPLFRTGWFVESLLTQTLIIHIIRTDQIPFFQSRASWPLIMTTAAVMVIGVWLPHSPLGPVLGFVPLPLLYWPLLLLTLTGYVLLTQVVKTWLARRYGVS